MFYRGKINTYYFYYILFNYTCNEYQMTHIWSVLNTQQSKTISKASELWSSQLWTQFKQLSIEAWKVRTLTGFEPVTSRYWHDALTNWAMKPLTLGAGHLWVLMSLWRMDVKWYLKCFIYWTADFKYAPLAFQICSSIYETFHIPLHN